MAYEDEKMDERHSTLNERVIQLEKAIASLVEEVQELKILSRTHNRELGLDN